MDICLIFCVAIAAAHIVVVSVAVIICQRWPVGDKNSTLGRFIDENDNLRRKMHRAGIG